MTTGFIEVRTTTETKADAEKIARLAVESRLAACAQIVGPIDSTYWWQGALENAAEYLLLLKTRETLFDTLRDAILSVHPYETPEIVALPITNASPSYLAWLENEIPS